jgi:inorganic triphosphatase YgiF
MPGAMRRLLVRADPQLFAGFESAADPRLVTVTDRYLDTARSDGRLALAGIRARLRDLGTEVVLTVKRPGVEERGVTTRVELEGPATAALDPGAWPESAARDALVHAAGGQQLREIARLRQRRLTRILRRGPTSVELSLDGLEALDGNHVVGRRYELEAELLGGEHVDLADLGDALRRLDGIGPPLGSKLRFALDSLSA